MDMPGQARLYTFMTTVYFLFNRNSAKTNKSANFDKNCSRDFSGIFIFVITYCVPLIPCCIKKKGVSESPKRDKH